MPIFNFVCDECKHSAEHFVYSVDVIKKCPKCASEEYKIKISAFSVNVEYSDAAEHYENKIEPHVQSIYAQIGSEAANGDTKTLNNVFGEDKVNNTFEST